MRVHFVELVNAAHPIVCQHECTSLDDKLASLFLTDDGGCQTGSRRCLAAGVHGTGRKVGNLEKLNNTSELEQNLLGFEHAVTRD